MNLHEKETILIVDDTPDIIKLLTTLLKDNYKTQVATNGINALELLATGSYPDLILLDVLMPEMGGYETCQRIKENPATADIPIIFLSGIAENQDVAMGLAFGASDFIGKPIFPAVLLARVATHLNLRRKIKELEADNRSLRLQLKKAIADTETPLEPQNEISQTTQGNVEPPEPENTSSPNYTPIELLQRLANMLRSQDTMTANFFDQYRNRLEQIIPKPLMSAVYAEIEQGHFDEARARLQAVFYLK
ncbi:two-component system response regulator [Chitinibacter sp. S2-10]|uniref:response regulator n=1 Tax=Chitinibacter sp. S2-10 TaxID=3373597 RepID=UPI003977ACB5